MFCAVCSVEINVYFIYCKEKTDRYFFSFEICNP